MQARIASGLTALGLTPPDGAAARLAEYGRLLLEQNQVMNLTAITEPDQVADLHFLDSAALLTLGEDLRGKRLIDVGTGAGFPGLPLRILEPSLQLTLLDSLGKRVNWLASVCNTLGLEGVECLHARAAGSPTDSSTAPTGTASTTPCPGPWPPWSSCASCVCPI